MSASPVRATSRPTRWAAISARTGSRCRPLRSSPSTRRSPASTCHELRAALAEHGICVAQSSLSRSCRRHGISRNKVRATRPSRTGRT
ncbi:hypothetical protein MMSR116_08865 [Methylobacterium mesophilicum SR1.6/6]|uniref:Uncharacterized protein n=1 Tax=Methylobacterium mesophilicum SR1.6/6 TaxID=908290 RepID=A0A6B9FM27_9HYPH|nr:hypothetical protein MMSR116_08865 [Methylobacterium mesophilicum SR1.6/6]